MARTASRRRGKPRGWGGRIANWLIRLVLLFLIGSILWVLLYRFVPPPVTFTQLGDIVSGRSITRDWMDLDDIDVDMQRAVIAGEDGKFCSHRGFDRDAIAAAMLNNARGGRIRGGSTISQQTAKNAFLWQGGGYLRKGLEAWFTLLVESMWSKRRIMEVYLNVAETGIATYGVNAGAQRYFDKDASNLSRSEAARIAAVLPLPKAREAVTPTGFTRRYGNSISARIGVIARDGLDACLEGDGERVASPSEQTPAPKRKAAPSPQPERIEDYVDPADQPPVADEEEIVPVDEAIEIDLPPVVDAPTPEPEPVEVNGL